MEQRPINQNSGIQANRPEPGDGKGRAQKAGRAGNAQRAQEAGQTHQSGKGKDAQGAEAGAAFHVLLDKLSRSAQELQENSGAVERPSDLADAVGRAKASLDDALDLGDQLLEAWRAERMNTPNESD